ncbi:nucleotidyltransferase family protein [Jiella sp. M17.18]|uniref:nucleotidyltransferase family protein n=1 Tax=Jiella sp. M17.18 TaxID=3234247 RepID=UPI0034DF1D38
MTPTDFLRCTMANPTNAALLGRLAALALPQCHLTAGCLFQTVWNARSSREPRWGIKDYDVFYFDERDLSFEAEDAVIRAVARAVEDLGVTVEVRNQARVHLWYEHRFGSPYPQLVSARDGIDRFLVACTCVGLELATGAVYAPDGFDDLEAGILRMNSRHARPERFAEKAAQYRARWPWLTIVP